MERERRGPSACVHPSRVSRALALLKLPEGIQEQVSLGNIPARSAYEISKLPDPHSQARSPRRPSLANFHTARPPARFANSAANRKLRRVQLARRSSPTTAGRSRFRRRGRGRITRSKKPYVWPWTKSDIASIPDANCTEAKDHAIATSLNGGRRKIEHRKCCWRWQESPMAIIAGSIMAMLRW